MDRTFWRSVLLQGSPCESCLILVQNFVVLCVQIFRFLFRWFFVLFSHSLRFFFHIYLVVFCPLQCSFIQPLAR